MGQKVLSPLINDHPLTPTHLHYVTINRFETYITQMYCTGQNFQCHQSAFVLPSAFFKICISIISHTFFFFSFLSRHMHIFVYLCICFLLLFIYLLLLKLVWLFIYIYKLMCTHFICFNFISGTSLHYLSDLLQPYSPGRQLRSASDTQTFVTPRVNTQKLVTVFLLCWPICLEQITSNTPPF